MDEQRPPVKGEEPRPAQIAEAPTGIQVVVYAPGGEVLYDQRATLRKFNTGSWGYHTAGKMACPRVADHRLQVNIQLTVIGSKDWGKEEGSTQ